MKNLIYLLTLTVLACSCQQAGQYTKSGTVLGALGGGVIGHNNKRHTAEGAGIGALAGGIIGYIIDSTRIEKKEVSVDRATSNGETVTIKRRVVVEEDVPVNKEVHVKKYYIDPDTGRRIYIN